MRALIGAMIVSLFALTGCDDSTGDGCPVGLENCAGECVNTNADPLNCGTCGVTCAEGERCETGSCVSLCGSGQEACGGVCVDTSSNPENCGACGVTCGSGERCVGGVCQGDSCPPGQSECSGVCVDLSSDPENCGSCGEACSGACFEGECQGECPEGLSDCDGRCVDLEKDEDNCGACGATCDAGENCEGGECLLNCPEGFVDCAGTCTDLDSDRDNCGECGASCDTGEVCDGGSCSSSGCSGGLTECDGACVDTDVDRENCGGCGSSCPDGEACVDGECGVLCPGEQVECDGECVNLATDSDNCGSCGNSCRDDQVCEGSCTCPGEREDCDGSCVDVRHDPENCGGCGTTCEGDEACVYGECTVSCPSGTTACGGFCVDTDSDHENCGSCGSPCGDDEACIGGVCIAGGSVPGDSCSTAIDVSGGGRFTGNTDSMSADYSGYCGGVSGRDVVFRYTLTERSDVYISTVGSELDTLLYVRQTCGGGFDYVCNDDAHGMEQSELRFEGQAAGTYYVILDSQVSSAGDYVFDIYFSEPSSRGADACGDPEWFDLGDTELIEANTCPWYWIDARDDVRTCATGLGGLDLVYAFAVDTTTTVSFSTCDDTSWDTVLDLRSVCDDSAASLICNDDACGTQSQIEATLEPGIYYLWIDGYSDGACGSFSIAVDDGE